MVKKILIFIVTCIIAVFIGYIDYITGQEILLTTFYLIPVAIAVWYSGMYYGLVISFVCCFLWQFIEIKSGTIYSSG
jgi:hypothetical protein